MEMYLQKLFQAFAVLGFLWAYVVFNEGPAIFQQIAGLVIAMTACQFLIAGLWPGAKVKALGSGEAAGHPFTLYSDGSVILGVTGSKKKKTLFPSMQVMEMVLREHQKLIGAGQDVSIQYEGYGRLSR